MLGVAECQNRIVSHAYVGLVEKIPRPDPGPRYLGYLTNVYTRPAYRSRGIGVRVVSWLQEWAHENHVELLVIWPSENSVEFYRRLGFVTPTDPLIWESSPPEP
jgi:GNAT superfamily N-acetyltransferase